MQEGRSERRSAHSRILTDPTTRRRCSKGSLPSQRAREHGRRGHRRRKWRLWFWEAFMCHCGFSAAARPSQGIRWAGSCSVEGAEGAKPSHDERSRCENVGKERDGGETVGGGELPLL